MSWKWSAPSTPGAHRSDSMPGWDYACTLSLPPEDPEGISVAVTAFYGNSRAHDSSNVQTELLEPAGRRSPALS